MITAGANSIALVHTHADGTIAYGTSKGDGSAEVLKANRWRWSRNLQAWYVPHSRDKLSKDWVIDATKTALETAGFEVEVRIHNDITRSVEERETDRAERVEARAEMLSAAGADRLGAGGEAEIAGPAPAGGLGAGACRQHRGPQGTRGRALLTRVVSAVTP